SRSARHLPIRTDASVGIRPPHSNPTGFERVQSRRFPGCTEAATQTLGTKWVAPLARRAASFLLPSRCLACGIRPAERLWQGAVCDACWLALPELGTPRCAACDEALPGAVPDARCGRCLLDPPAFDALRAAVPYSGSARRILLAFKFQGAD